MTCRTFLCWSVILLAPTLGRADAKQEADAFRAQGVANLQKKEFDRAIADFDQAVRRMPQEAMTYCLRGCAYAAKRDLERALTDYNEAIRLDPKLVCLYGERATAYVMKGDHDRALADFNEAIRLDPAYAHLYYDRGRVHVLKQDFGRAFADFSEVIRLKPGHADAYCARGSAGIALRKYAGAAADFQEAARLEPTLAMAHANVGFLLATCPEATLRDGKRAVGCARKGCELTHWQQPAMVSVLAAACAEAGDFRGAVKWEKNALDLAVSVPTATIDEMRGRLRLYEEGKPYRIGATVPEARALTPPPPPPAP